MRETCTYGSMRGSRRKTAKSVLRVVEDRAGVPDEGRSALLYSDEKAAMDIAQSVADEVGRVCGFEMKHPIYSSIRCGKSDNVTLFSGHGGKLVAEVLWVRQGKEEGFIRLLLHDTGSICEKSPLYEEIMAN